MTKLAARRHGPKAPRGLESVYAIVLARQKRELQRLHGSTYLKCTLAQNQLSSGSAGERERAAKALGHLRYLHSYEPLLCALAREGRHGSRAVKAAILEALGDIGGEHAGQTALMAGREPLKRFSMAHLDDAGLVRSALDASGWTVSFMGDAFQDLDEVKDAARRAAAKGGPNAGKYDATAAQASDLYFDWIRSR
jgi:hypothetical protein